MNLKVEPFGEMKLVNAITFPKILLRTFCCTFRFILLKCPCETNPNKGPNNGIVLVKELDKWYG